MVDFTANKAIQQAESEFSVILNSPSDTTKESKERRLYFAAKSKIAVLEKENKALKSQQSVPPFQVAVRMALSMINRHLTSIVNYNGPDSPYETGEAADCHVTWVMELAAKRAKQALNEHFESFDGLDELFYEISGAAECALKSLTTQDSAYGCYLKALTASVDTLAELCDTIALRGEDFFLDMEVKDV